MLTRKNSDECLSLSSEYKDPYFVTNYSSFKFVKFLESLMFEIIGNTITTINREIVSAESNISLELPNFILQVIK